MNTSSDATQNRCSHCGQPMMPAMARCRECGQVPSRNPLQTRRTVRQPTPPASRVAEPHTSAGDTEPRDLDVTQLLAMAETVAGSQNSARPSPQSKPSPSRAGTGGRAPVKEPSDSNTVVLLCACKRKLRVNRTLAGKRVKCPRCDRVVRVPGPLHEQALPATSDAASPPLPTFRQMADEITDAADETSNGAKTSFERKRTLKWRQFRRLSKLLRETKAETTSEIEERREALLELGKSGDARGAELSLPYLDATPVRLRVAAAAALGQLGDPAAVAPLIASLDSGEPDVVRAALSALGKIADRRAVRPLLTLGLAQPPLSVLVYDAVLEMGEAATPVLLDVLNDSDPEMVLHAVILLGRLRDKRAVKALILAQETRSPVLRRHVAEALGQFDDLQAVTPLSKMLEDADPLVRLQAAASLANIPNAASVRPLIRALRDDELDVRIRAAGALGEIGDASAAEPLSRLLTAENDSLRVAAAEALGRIGDHRAVEPLLSLLKSDDEAHQLKAIGALKKLKDSRAVEGLVGVLDHSKPNIRQRAADALGQIGNSITAQRLGHVLKTDRSAEVRAAAAKSLGELGDRVSLEALQEALRDEFAVQCKAIAALGQIGDAAALPALLAMLKDVTPELRYHAAGALAELGHQNAVAPLQALVDDQDPLVRRGAGKALEKLDRASGGALLKADPQRTMVRSAGKRIGSLVPYQLAYLWPESARSKSIVAATVGAALLIAGLVTLGLNVTASENAKPRGRVQSLAFSADGRSIAAGRTFGLVEIWGVETGKRSGAFASDFAAIRDLAYSADGKLLLLTDGQSLAFWESAGRKSADVTGHMASINGMLASADHTTLATSSTDGIVLLWDPQTGRQQGALRLELKGATAVALAPDAKAIAAAGNRGDVYLWDSSDGKQLHKYTGAQGPVRAIAFSVDGKQIAAAAQDGAITIWDVETEQPATKLTAEKKRIYTRLIFLPSSQRLVAVCGSAIDLWELSTGKPQPLPTTEAEQYDVAAVSPDGKLLAAGGQQNSEIWLFDLESLKLVNVLNISR